MLGVATGLAAAASASTDPEPLLRSALNRTYYAAFISLVNRIKAECGPGSLPVEHVHREVKDRLERQRLYGLQLLRDKLRTLEAGRDWADYETDAAAPPAKFVDEAIGKAERAVHYIKRQLTPVVIRRLG